MLEKVVLACDLQTATPFWLSRVLGVISGRMVNPSPEKECKFAIAVDMLQKTLGVEVVKKTNLIAVNYESPDPELAGRILTALTNFYLEKHLAVHRPPGAFDFFQQETAAVSQGIGRRRGPPSRFHPWWRTGFGQTRERVAATELAESTVR